MKNTYYKIWNNFSRLIKQTNSNQTLRSFSSKKIFELLQVCVLSIDSLVLTIPAHILLNPSVLLAHITLHTKWISLHLDGGCQPLCAITSMRNVEEFNKQEIKFRDMGRRQMMYITQNQSRTEVIHDSWIKSEKPQCYVEGNFKQIESVHIKCWTKNFLSVMENNA